MFFLSCPQLPLYPSYYTHPLTPTRKRISIPPKYRSTCASYKTSVLPAVTTEPPDAFYSSILSLTRNIFTCRQQTPHCTSPQNPCRFLRVKERKAIEDDQLFKEARLHHYQTSRDTLITLRQTIQTDSWQQLTNSINHLTSVGSIWHRIHKIVTKKKAPAALHHSPAEYAQSLIIASSKLCSLHKHVVSSRAGPCAVL